MTPGVAFLHFVNAVGRLRLPHLGDVELVSGKWGEADFDRLLGELTEIASALPFASGTGPGLEYSQVSDGSPLLYHAFVYLRHVLTTRPGDGSGLVDAVRAVLRNPHVRFAPVGRTVPLERARSVGTWSLMQLVTRPGRLMEAAGAGPVAAALGGYLPERVEEDHRRTTVDTPENRFVRAFLDQAADIVERVRMAAGGKGVSPAFRDRLRQDCDRLGNILDPLRRHPMWEDVGDMHQLPAASTVLQRRFGYRQVFQHYVRLRLASRLPLSRDPLNDLLELKDIATLYELWCFFVVERAVEQVRGKPSRALMVDGGLAGFNVTLARGVEVTWPDGTQLAYNATFSRTGENRSTSVVLRPDIILRVPDGPEAGLHVFDAKFRLRSLASWSSGDADELGNDSTYRRGDLYKMHTYRDALEGARSAWVLYPGAPSVFFPALPGDVVDGVGAVALAPGREAGIVQWAKAIG